MRRSLAICGYFLSLTACSEHEASVSRLSELRLLALAVDKPSAVPGESLELTALYYQPHEKPLEWAYAQCSAEQNGDDLHCLQNVDLDTLTIARDKHTYQLAMPAGQSPGSVDAVSILVLVCPGQVVVQPEEPLPLSCHVQGKAQSADDLQFAVKRVFYQRGGNNQNPTIDAVLWDGEPWPEDELKSVTACDRNADDVDDCKVAYQHTLRVAAPQAAEEYVDPVGSKAYERTAVQFFASGGTLEWSTRAPDMAETRFVARALDVGNTLSLFVVLRDNRGGVSWQTRRIQVVSGKAAPKSSR